MNRSMRCKGDCWDNVPNGGHFNSRKNERVDANRYANLPAAIADVLD